MPAPSVATAARDVAVAIVNWNRTDSTVRAVSRLLAWDQPPEIHVVDNGSHDGGAEALRRNLSAGEDVLRILDAGTNLGYGAANNLVLEGTDKPFVLLLNDDARIEPRDLDQLLATAAAEPSIGAVGPLLFDDSGTRVVAAGGLDIGTHIRTHARPERDDVRRLREGGPIPVDYVPGTAALLERSACAAVGNLDPRYFYGGELADLCRRLRRAGRRVLLDPAASARHDLAVADERRSSLYSYYVLRNRFLYVRSDGMPARLRGLAAWTLYGLAVTARAGLRGDARKFRALGRGFLDGILGRVGDGNHRVPGVAERIGEA